MDRTPFDVRKQLLPLLPEGSDPAAAVPEEAARKTAEHWTRLTGMGFDLEVSRDCLRVRHRDRRYETVIQLSGEEDMEERRALFHSLKSAFGGVTDRFLSWAFQPSPAVREPYESLREIVSTCQSLRRRRAATT